MKRNEQHSNIEFSTYDFNEDNRRGLLDLFEYLPKQHYQIETFDTCDKTGFVIEFGEDLFIKVNYEDKEEFEKFFGFEIGDHVDVDLRHLQIGEIK
jgi:hypothetical protein